MTEVRFFCIASGSSGNSYFISADGVSFLIDAGVGIRTTKKILKERNFDINSLHAVLVTHDHADHIRTVGYLGEKIGIPIYATADVHRGINSSYCTKTKLLNSAKIISKNEPFNIGHFNITAFEVPHDSTDNVGYYIEIGDISFAFLTDLGEITPLAASYARMANYLIIESNYDRTMLDMGPYPQALKDRIKSKNGHMSNIDTAKFLAENYNPKLKHIWLCHLSNDNNKPDLAYKTVELAMQNANIIVGRDVMLNVLERHRPSDLYSFYVNNIC